MTEETMQTGCCCGISALCDHPVGPGHNDDIDLQFMLTVLKAAHELVADPTSGWRQRYSDVQQLRKYVRHFIAEQLRSIDGGEPADPNQDMPIAAETVVTNTSCAVCRSNYYACMQTIPQPTNCYEQYVNCIAEPCI